MQASAASFSAEPAGHLFQLRAPLAKATANRCAVCSRDVREHARCEVTDHQLLSVLSTQDDGSPSIVLPGELAIGSYKAALAACRDQERQWAVLNCAGQRLHAFMPPTKAPFDHLRGEARLYDLEWEDSESFDIPLSDVVGALEWSSRQVGAGRTLLVSCAQGKSRSGTMAVAFLVAKERLSVAEALARVQSARPLVQPNPRFMRALAAFEPELRRLPAPVSAAEAALRVTHAACDVDGSSGLNVDELRRALVRCGVAPNAARGLLETHDADGDGELSVDEFVRAWAAEGFGPPPRS